MHLATERVAVEIRLDIDGMTCGGCVAAVERVLRARPGVAAVRVDLAAGRATVDTHHHVSEADLAAAVCAAGFEARVAP